MINKYAEIQDRIILYNACKGILRVKAAKMDAHKEFQMKADDYMKQGMSREEARAQAEKDMGMQHGVNPYEQQQTANDTPADTSTEQKGTNLLSYSPAAIGAVGGGIGGGIAGNKATGWINDKLGLTDDRGGWRKWLGRGLRTVGTIGGTIGGAFLGGNAAHGFARDWSASDLANAKQREARKAERKAAIEQASQQAVEPKA